jgi:exonuclease SbcD
VKLVHTSDWHVGAWLGTIDRRPDLETALDALIDLAAEVKPDLIIHTGDLFDRALPAGDDVRLAADALCRLAAVAPVLVLCGNHDGRATFGGIDKFCSVGGNQLRLLAQLDVRSPLLAWPTADGGRVRVGAVPFQPLAAAGFPALADGTLTAGAYADRIRQLWAIIGAAFAADRKPGDVDIAAAHLHVAGAVLARSEKTVHVSDDAATDPAALPAVSYAAYGHIHKPQTLPGGVAGRYAGSIIPIDFGEAGETKGAVVVEAAPGRGQRIEAVTLASGRPLVNVTGAFADLGQLLAAIPDSIVRVQVTDTERIDHLASRVADLLASGAACQNVTQPALTRQVTRAHPADGEADVLTLLANYAATSFGDPSVVEGLTALWSAADIDPDADLTAGALTALTSVLDGETIIVGTADDGERNAGLLEPEAPVPVSAPLVRRGGPRKAR